MKIHNINKKKKKQKKNYIFYLRDPYKWRPG